VRVEHHAQDAVDAEPGMPEAGVGVVHFVGRAAWIIAGQWIIEKTRRAADNAATLPQSPS